MLSPLPIPSLTWLQSANAQQHQSRMEVRKRPFHALGQWAIAHGQPGTLEQLILSHLGGPAWKSIYEFYRTNTSLTREEAVPFLSSCFYYDQAFWPLHIPIIYGQAIIHPIKLIKGMPLQVIEYLCNDHAKLDELKTHVFDCLDHLGGMNEVVEHNSLANSLAANFLEGADGMLASTVASLLSGPPNEKAAEHARFAFESTLKALAAERAKMTDEKALKKIGHDLDNLLRFCHSWIGLAEHKRLDGARHYFPEVSARYTKQTIPGEDLWKCYEAARYASATVLRTLGGPDSRPAAP